MDSNTTFYLEHIIEMELDNLFGQIAHNKPVFNQRPLTIYLEFDYNKTSLKPDQIDYLMDKLKELLIDQFSLFTPLNNVFILFYLIVILFGLISNSLMIYIFYKSLRLQTYRNIFIINLAIKFVSINK